MSGEHSLRFLGIGNMLDREYRNSPAYQWGRELIRNGIEANAKSITIGPEWQAVETRGVYRLQYADDGDGMDREHLRDYMRTIGKGSKTVGGAHDNYALGCRMTLLPWNPAGVVVISVVAGEAHMVKMMHDPEANDSNGEYVLDEVEWTDDYGNEGRSIVYPPYLDDDGVNWMKAVPPFIWEAGHGTTFVMLGRTGNDDTIEGDPERSESIRFLTRKYFNVRFWNLPETVRLACVEFTNPTDRTAWPKSPTDKGWQNRTVTGSQSLIEFVRRTGEKAVQSSGTVSLPDATKAHWWLRNAATGDTGGLGSASGFIAVKYRDELYGHAYANHDDGDTRVGAAVYRQFGIGIEALRRKIFIVLEPPEYDETTGGPGVAPSTGRADLYWMGAGLSPRSVKASDWAEAFAEAMPDEIEAAIRAVQEEEAGNAGDRNERLHKVMDRFSKRWKAARARLEGDPGKADTVTTPTAPGSTPRQPIDLPNPQRKRSNRKRVVVVRGRGGDATLGLPGIGAEPARRTSVTLGYPDVNWVTANDLADEGMIAAWSGPSKGHPNGLVELDLTHPVIRGQIDYWRSQYPKALGGQVEKVVKDAYEDVAIAKVSHMHSLTPSVISETQRDMMLENPALTTALLGLIGEDALITPRLGGLGAKRRRSDEDATDAPEEAQPSETEAVAS